MKKITSIDLFAGVGGMRIALNKALKKMGLDHECKLYSELNLYCQHTYDANFSGTPLIKDIKSALNYKDVIIRTYNKKLFEISISDEKDTLNLNKIIAEIKKFKFNIDEAGFLKSNLDDVFRKITQEKNKI